MYKKTYYILAMLLALLMFVSCSNTSDVEVSEASASQSEAAIEEVPDATDELGLPRFKDEKEFYTMLDESSISVYNQATPLDGSLARGEMLIDSAVGGDFSETNAQVEGVEEGEIVKTDGEYIYTALGGTVRIVRVSRESMEVVSTVELDKRVGVSELYISDNTLVVVGSRLKTVDFYMSEKMAKAFDWYRDCVRTYAVYALYDISDKANPKEIQIYEVSGDVLVTRVKDGALYYATKDNAFYRSPYPIFREEVSYEEIDKSIFMPSFSNSLTGDNDTYASIDAVSYLVNSNSCSFLQVGVLALDGTSEAVPMTIFGGGDNFYMDNEYAIIACTELPTTHTETGVYKFEITESGLKYAAEARIDGRVLDQYSMDIYEGNTRIVTSDSRMGNNLYVLDEDMVEVGSIEDLAVGESVRSARFIGDTAYVVTFKNIDPLFVIDISDIKNPVVRGELKIPGFSQYLHPIDDGLLLGIGRDTEAMVTMIGGKPVVSGFKDIGMKVSLFDVRDPLDPQEVSKLTYGDDYVYSVAALNPRALMVDKSKKLLGLPAMGYDGAVDSYMLDPTKVWYGGIVIGVDGDSIFESMRLKSNIADKDALNSGMFASDVFETRMIYIGDELYVVAGDNITAYCYTSYKPLGEIKF